MPKRKLSTAKKTAWSWFSQWIRLSRADQNGYVQCYTCDAIEHYKDMDAGHWLPRTRGNSVFFDENNVRPQCKTCNQGRAGMTHIFTQNMIAEFGPEIVEEMEQKASQIVKYSLSDYDRIAKEYRERVKEIECFGPL